jgi:hypothetical protein
VQTGPLHLGPGKIDLPRPLAEADLAVASELIGVTGKYFRLNGEARSSIASYDREQACRLWDLSVKFTGLSHRPVV